jgi:hypothetical protein
MPADTTSAHVWLPTEWLIYTQAMCLPLKLKPTLPVCTGFMWPTVPLPNCNHHAMEKPTLEQRIDRLLTLLENRTNDTYSKTKLNAINAVYTVLGSLIIIALTYAFSFITEIKSTNQRQDRDIIERGKLDVQKWKSIDYNFEVLNKDNIYLYKINDDKTN